MRLIDADAFIEWIDENVSEYTPSALVTKAVVISALKSKNVAPTVGGWISVKDWLPENNQNVLVCLYDGRRRKISDYPDGRRKTIRIDHIVTKYGSPAFWSKGNTTSVIAWMPMPSTEGLDET